MTHCRCSDKVSPFMPECERERETGARDRDKGRCACHHNVKRETRVSTSSVVLVCVEELQAAAGSQQPLCAVQAGSHRLTDLLCRQGALCTQQYIEHPQLTGGEHHLGQRERKQSRNVLCTCRTIGSTESIVMYLYIHSNQDCIVMTQQKRLEIIIQTAKLVKVKVLFLQKKCPYQCLTIISDVF